MADGTGVELEVSRFESPALEMVRSQIADASVIQAVGRCRPVNRTPDTPVTIWVLSKILLPWPVNDVCRWEDVALDPVERMAARGVWTDSSCIAAALFPQLFPTPGAAKLAIHRHRKRVQPARVDAQSTAAAGLHLPYKSPYKGGVTELRVKVARSGGHYSTLSCIDSALPGLEQRLAEALGALEVFSVGEPPAAPVPSVVEPVPPTDIPFMPGLEDLPMRLGGASLAFSPWPSGVRRTSLPPPPPIPPPWFEEDWECSLSLGAWPRGAEEPAHPP